ncbi:MAG TPA: hypothetical protein ENH31_00980 [Nitrospirae bacterium]|nr:hypothetical protein BMS3Abin10_02376 [bacterium BMS3Abin10]GBE38317.1 hypothetical protein BMS3Bbin08_00922 [bacterium BMS3Bbin08]HDH51206.1 hypothetical protein [Nitrospirota bacterium]HDK17213.1 hypothetical protein [Nitrospirota bacterium]HDK81127.1 hypothetical protein [Nitrospirota bacterium]
MRLQPEIQSWLNSALKSQAELIEVDSTGDGEITTADADNAQLAAWLVSGDLDAAYVNSRIAMYGERSPWFPGVDLWKPDDAAAGQIAVKSNNSPPFEIEIRAWDRLEKILYLKKIYAD